MPLHLPDAQLTAFLHARQAWMVSHCAAVQAGRQAYTTGEIHPLWGVPMRLVVQEGKDSASCDGKTIFMFTQPDATALMRRKLLYALYRKELERALPAVIADGERRTGLHAAQWRLRDMSTRWGSCSIAKGRIWLSLNLAKKPPDCLEMVAVHELVHLLERGHNARFYGFMDQFYPQWRQCRQWLKAPVPGADA